MKDDKIILKLAKFLKDHRIKAGLSQDKLAWKSGVSKPTIQVIEYGKTQNPRFLTIIKLCKALNINYNDLFALF